MASFIAVFSVLYIVLDFLVALVVPIWGTEGGNAFYFRTALISAAILAFIIKYVTLYSPYGKDRD